MLPRISARSTNRTAAQGSRGAAPAGFTLLEVLVVLVLVGIILSLAVLSFGGTGPRERLDQEARRLIQLVALAREEAILQVQDLALEPSPDGYRFARLESVAASGGQATAGAMGQLPGLEWRPITDDPLLRQRALPDGHELLLFADAPGVAPGGGNGDDDENRPRVYLAPSGEMTPFELRLRDREAGVELRVLGEADGRVRIAEDPAP